MTAGAHTFKAFQMQVGLWPVYLSAIATALGSPFSRPGYRVNVKIARRTSPLQRALALWPNLAVIAASAAAIGHGIFRGDHEPAFLAVLVFWASWTIVVLSRYALVGLHGEWQSERAVETRPSAVQS
jgi:hypothetical protein